jgi:hypothetical protein
MIDFDLIAWDDADDPEGNVQHVAEHDLTPDEVDAVLYEPLAEDESHSSGRPVVFGWTPTGRFILVVYEVEEAGGYVVVHPVTAYEVRPPA